jgi:hypothetical protein
VYVRGILSDSSKGVNVIFANNYSSSGIGYARDTTVFTGHITNFYARADAGAGAGADAGADVGVDQNASSKVIARRDPIQRVKATSPKPSTPEEQIFGTPTLPLHLRHPRAMRPPKSKVCRNFNGLSFRLKWSLNSRQFCNNDLCAFEHVCIRCKSNRHIFRHCPN